MFSSKNLKKIITSVVLGAFVLTIPTTALANVYSETPDKVITVVKQEDSGLYKLAENKISLFSDKNTEKAVLCEELGFYKVQSEENLYLDVRADGQYIPVEENKVRTITELQTIAETYNLTETEKDDIISILKQNPNVDLTIYAPRASTESGTYNGKSYQMVTVTATDNASTYTIAKGLNLSSLVQNTVIYAIGTLGSKANTGITITTAVLGLLNIDFQFKSDSTCTAKKNETAYFQYLDFYELGTAYITRGINSYGTIGITTSTTCWVRQSNGDYVNTSKSGKPVSGTFGSKLSKETLAGRSYGYFEDYSGLGATRYENYVMSFKVDGFNSIPAISPKR